VKRSRPRVDWTGAIVISETTFSGKLFEAQFHFIFAMSNLGSSDVIENPQIIIKCS
jgi:hypothetical protein